jgi:protein tyrosine phosphatase (PTP) superfamily phosphohydrolase (DUF442 family)
MENSNEEIWTYAETKDLEDMEKTGYATIIVGDPTQKDVDEVNKKFEESEKDSASGITFCEGGSECRRFLNTGDENAEVNAPVPVRKP